MGSQSSPSLQLHQNGRAATQGSCRRPTHQRHAPQQHKHFWAVRMLAVGARTRPCSRHLRRRGRGWGRRRSAPAQRPRDPKWRSGTHALNDAHQHTLARTIALSTKRAALFQLRYMSLQLARRLRLVDSKRFPLWLTRQEGCREQSNTEAAHTAWCYRIVMYGLLPPTTRAEQRLHGGLGRGGWSAPLVAPQQRQALPPRQPYPPELRSLLYSDTTGWHVASAFKELGACNTAACALALGKIFSVVERGCSSGCEAQGMGIQKFEADCSNERGRLPAYP